MRSKVNEIIDQFRLVDKNDRLLLLLDYASTLEPLSLERQSEKGNGESRVHECMSPVYLWVTLKSGRVHVEADADPEAPTVRGFVSLLASIVEGSLPHDVAEIPETLLYDLGIAPLIGMQRLSGLTHILNRIKREVALLNIRPI